MIAPLWEAEQVDPACWAGALELSAAWLQRLPELGAQHVVATRPASVLGRHFNQGFILSAEGGMAPLRCKFRLPDEPGLFEARWFAAGDPAFPSFRAGALSFGLNICTELWALESYAAYAAGGVQVILAPRATAAATTAKWLAVGVAGAVRSGAFSVSSNRVDPTGNYGGVGWIISPDGRILASTTREAPFATVDIDLAASDAARSTYPRYVFSESSSRL